MTPEDSVDRNPAGRLVRSRPAASQLAPTSFRVARLVLGLASLCLASWPEPARAVTIEITEEPGGVLWAVVEGGGIDHVRGSTEAGTSIVSARMVEDQGTGLLISLSVAARFVTEFRPPGLDVSEFVPLSVAGFTGNLISEDWPGPCTGGASTSCRARRDTI